MVFCSCETSLLHPVPYIVSFPASRQGERVFESNFIKSSKYTLLSFLPKALLLQYARFANIYFLFIAILSSIGLFDVVNSKIIWFPILVVLALSLIREAYEDYKRYTPSIPQVKHHACRYLGDCRINFESIARVAQGGNWVEVQWSEVLTGDIVQVRREETFPADIILLDSSQEDGSAFIQTSSLDGEKNLKPKEALNISSVMDVKGNIVCIQPNRDLNVYSGKLSLNGIQINIEGIKQYLYRGAKLKSVQWVVGVVVYTGRNTKIMLNSKAGRMKTSQFQKKLNKMLIFLLCLKVSICIIIATLSVTILPTEVNKNIYWKESYTSATKLWFQTFFNYVILLSSIIPISLIVSLDFVKIAQSYFIDFDCLLRSFNSKPAQAKSFTLNQQLGQVKYIFTDKTGTLTKNQMTFQTAFIGRNKYDFRANPLSCPPLHQLIKKQNISSTTHYYLLTLCLCHDGFSLPLRQNECQYQSPSPDQICLLNAAKCVGYQFIRSTATHTTLRINNTLYTYQILQRFPFDPIRKMMSILILHNGCALLLTKGADSSLYPRLTSSSLRQTMEQKLHEISLQGLRTLLIAMRVVPLQEYRALKQRLNALSVGASERMTLLGEVEHQLQLLGATAIRDALQDCLSATLTDLLQANIRLWMLTGDKQETAEGVSRACGLLPPNCNVVRIAPQCTSLNQYLQSIGSGQTALVIGGGTLTSLLQSQGKQFAEMSLLCCAVICYRMQPMQKAQVVQMIRKHLRVVTLAIGDGANDVPMIRAAHVGVGLAGQQGLTAAQASDYVLGQFRLLRRLLFVHGRWNYLRLSQMALYFLYKSLLFTTPTVIFAFYNRFSAQPLFDDLYILGYNLVFTALPLLAKALFQQDFNYVQRGALAVVTVEEEVLRGGMEREALNAMNREGVNLPPGHIINKQLYMSLPVYYRYGQEGQLFSWQKVTWTAVQAVISSTFIYMIVSYSVSSHSVDSFGRSGDLWTMSITMYSVIIVVVTLKLAMQTRHWTWFLGICIGCSSLLPYPILVIVTHHFFSRFINHTPYIVFRSWVTFITLLICTLLFIAVDCFLITFFRAREVAQIQRREIQIRERSITKTSLMQDQFKKDQNQNRREEVITSKSNIIDVGKIVIEII